MAHEPGSDAPVPEPPPGGTKPANPSAPPPDWSDHARRVLFLVFALAAALCGVARAFGWANPNNVDRDTLLFFLTAGVLLLLDRVSKFSLTKDGVSWETVKDAVAASVKEQVAPVTAEVSAVKSEVAQVEKTAARTQQMVATGVGKRTPPAPDDAGAVAFSPGGKRATGARRRAKKWALPDPTVGDDPQKGRFGGHSAANGRELTADVEESDYIPGLYTVTLEVRAAPHAPNPLTGTVTFYLHDTFDEPVLTVPVSKKGVARLEVSAYGAFTVGAVADDGTTMLELDMAEVPEFPEAFREL